MSNISPGRGRIDHEQRRRRHRRRPDRPGNRAPGQRGPEAPACRPASRQCGARRESAGGRRLRYYGGRCHVADRGSVEALVQAAAALGAVDRIVHAAGVSPSQASIETILRVDLYGTALVLELFGNVVAPTGSAVVIASQSGHRLPSLTPEEDRALATTPTEDLLALPMLAPGRVDDTLHAYQLSKRANALRVSAEAVRWGKRGARVNCLSPGIVITPLARDELTGPRGAGSPNAGPFLRSPRWNA